MKRSFLLFVLLFLFSTNNNLFAQTWWAQRAGGITPDEGADISIDAAGNTYTTGYFTGSATFGTLTLNSSGITDVFLTKTDNLGVFEWSIKAGGIGSDRGHAIKTDAQGNSYITGYYYGTATFGTQNITSLGVQDVFIAKYDNTGTLVWVASAGGSSADIGNGINIDNSGNVVITGEFTGTATFGSYSLTSLNNSVDVFSAKLDASGNFLWAEKGSAPDIDRGLDVACDAGGNIYVTGQFTDTITFDVSHNNNTYNAIFVVKYNSNGEEQWFRRIGAGSMNVVGGIAVDGSDNVYLTGDFTGSVIFFGTTNTMLTNTYANRIFVAKYNSAGDLLWAEADGSSSEISSKNIALDADGNPYIVGNFKCRLNEYADVYGQGTFNSVGFWDIFVSKYTTNGVWQLSRSCGGKQDDYGAGITVNAIGQMYITGSFFQQMVFPVPTNFLGYNVTNVYSGGAYCNETNYNVYKGLNSTGNSDIFITKKFDPTRAPYDYYRRPVSTACNRDYKEVCINGNVAACPDTVTFCNSGPLFAYSFTTPAGPAFTYDWTPGGIGIATNVSATGYYSVTQTSVDGCFSSTDSIYVIINPAPPVPTISDNLDTNVNAIITEEIVICFPDSVLLTGGGYNEFSFGWTTPDTAYNFASSVWAAVSGTYSFHTMDTNLCNVTNSVTVTVEEPFPPVSAAIISRPEEDTVSICEGGGVEILLYDTISNPFAIDTVCPFDTVVWTVTSTNFFSLDTLFCNYSIHPEESGEYFINAMAMRINVCDTDTVFASYSLYIEILPVPNIDPLSVSITLVGSSILCPGDSSLLIASAAPNYLWSGPGGVSGNINDSVWVFQQGGYSVSTSLSDTNEYGCIAGASASASQTITSSPQPTVIMNPTNGLMCPNDSVRLQCSGSGTFQWYGPSGPIGGNVAAIYVNTPGNYYCVRTDANGCELVSNTVEANQYATPFLLVTPDAGLCEGDSAIIEVITNQGSLVQWQSPFSGNSPTQTVFQPGIYSCMITSCGIQTLASAEVYPSDISAEITPSDALQFCGGDSVTLYANTGHENYFWQPINSIDSVVTVYESGIYTLIVSDNSGCADTAAVTVTVTPDTIVPALALSPVNVLCNNDSLIISVVANPGSPVQWLAPLSGSTQTQVIDSAGTYSCIVTSCGVDAQVSVIVTAVTLATAITANDDLDFCEGDSVTLESTTVTENYLWQQFGSDTIVVGGSLALTVFQSGIYMLTVTDTNGCNATDSVAVTAQTNNLAAPTVSDTAICSGGYAILYVTGSGTISWFDVPFGGISIASGNTFTTPVLSTEALYYVMQEDEFCKSEKAPVIVAIADCENITAANVFSPNGDNVNDEYVFPITGATCFDCKIYNRWGRLLYEWTDASKGWDGTNMHTGNTVNDGVYFYVLNWCSATTAQKREAGFIQLVK